MKGENRHPLKGMALMSAIISQLVGSVLVGIFLANGWMVCGIPDRSF